MNNTNLPPNTTPNIKGGRPKLRDDEKRNIKQSVYYDKSTHDAIKIAAKDAGIAVSYYIYQVSKKGYVIQPITIEAAQYFRILAGIGNNLNQLTRNAHANGIANINSRLEKVLDIIEETINGLSQLYS